MQRVANCILARDNQVLLLKKPRRGWWAIPGGKMEPTETVRNAAIREFSEETGLMVSQPVLKGVYTFVIKENDEIINEWMMFTFFANEATGELTKETDEGILEWHPYEKVSELQMAEGDHYILKHCLNGEGIQFGTFVYTPDNELLSAEID